MNKENIWLGVEQLTNDPGYVQTVNTESGVEPSLAEQLVKNGQSSNRRDFLKYLGFGLGAATVAASCEIPVKRAIPYVVKPDEIVPGVATYYASTFVSGGDYCPVLVKTREGRPIKVEGNTLSSVTKGGTSARAQASVLSLYDNNRFQGPALAKNYFVMKKDDSAAAWDAVDNAVTQKLTASSNIRIVSNTILSPLTKNAIAEFKKAFPNTGHVVYDAVSSSAMIQANEATFGIKGIPSYRFDLADTIVSFNADFLGTWISPVEFATQYSVNRKLNKDLASAKMSHHTQVESHMSLTGSNADNRIMVKPSEQGAAMVALYNALAGKAGKEKLNGPQLSNEVVKKFEKLADKLWASQGSALVVCGNNNKSEQILVNAINDILGSYGRTISFERISMLRQGVDGDVQNLIKEMNAGQVDAIFFMDGVNPAYDLANREEFAQAITKVSLKVSFSILPNETSSLCDVVAPTNHYLESWGDTEAYSGIYTLIQPTISPIFATRQVEESLLKWAGNSVSAYDFLKETWNNNLFSKQSSFGSFQAFWDQSLHDGVLELPASGNNSIDFSFDLTNVVSGVTQPFKGEGLEISFFETVNMGGGQYANNPWLQELPDPINRCVWGNYLGIPISWDGGNKFLALNDLNQREFYGEADKVDLTIGEIAQRVTVVRQFGQMPGTVSLAMGYGRTDTGIQGLALGNQVGVPVQQWLTIDKDGNTQYFATGVSVSTAVEKEKDFACVQYHHSMGLKGIDPVSGESLNVDEKTDMTVGSGYQGGLTERSIIYQSTLKEVKNLSDHIAKKRGEAEKLNQHTLYPYDEYKENYYEQGHHWKMHVDLNAC
ncbi:MAG: hypothetical protein RJA52_534, partial [Bacteroidota bacterium]